MSTTPSETHWFALPPRHRRFLPAVLGVAMAIFLLDALHLLPALALALLIGVCLGLLGAYAIQARRAATAAALPPELALVTDVVAEPFLITHADGRILAANAAARQLFGYSAQQLAAMTVEQLMPERMREAHRRRRHDYDTHPTVRPMGVANGLLARKCDGSEFPVEIQLYPVTLRGTRYVAVTVRDLSTLRASERLHQQLSSILEDTSDFVVMCNLQGAVYYVNAGGRALLGIDADTPSGVLADYMPAHDFERIQREALPQAMALGSWSGEIEMLRRDGQQVPVAAVILAHRDAANGALDYYSVVARDMTDHRRHEERLRRINRTYAVLSHCNQTLIRATDETNLIRDFCAALVELGGYRFAWFGMGRDDDDRTVQPLAHAGHEAGYLASARISWSEATERGLGPVGAAVRSGTITIGRDMEHDAALQPWREEARKRGYRSLIALPVGQREASLRGCLSIYAAEVDAFDSDEIKLLAELANDLGFGIQTLRARRARAEAESLSRLRAQVIEAAHNGVLIAEARPPDYPIIYANHAFEQITGYARDESLARPLTFLFGDDQADLEGIGAALRLKYDASATLRNQRKDGTLFWSDFYVTPVHNEAGEVTHFACIVNDITQRKLYEEQLEYQANHDQLTGLPSRALMLDRLAQLIAASIRHKRTLSLLFLDLDQFKLINDTLGHRIGDELLKVTANRLAACIREGDTLCRYGGDEFVLLLPDTSRPEDVGDVARRIMDAVSQPATIEGHTLQGTISIGASVFPRDGTDAETMLKNADAAMYRAKELGRNTLQFYTTELNERAVERLTMEAELRRAIEKNQLILHYQPRVDLRTGRIVGCEALVRWQHPTLGLVSPAKFIPIAEETGLIVPLGEWVLIEACAQNRTWLEMGFPPITVAVNVSARQLELPDLHTRLATVLRTTGLNAEDLELELTESAIMDDPAEMKRKLQQLKDLGVLLSIDDFGTGFSSLSHLSAFPFDALKIDQSFIRHITTSAQDAEIALAIIALAHSLKLRVIAEGVETEGQLRYLQRHNCDEFQGYYFGRPMEPAAFSEMLRAEKTLAPWDGAHPAPTVLLVDDDNNVLEALRRVLHRESYRILTANSAREAFELLASNEVDLIISDQRMPETTGIEFLSQVKDLYPETIRIVLSAFADQETVLEAFNNGEIYRFIRKPWDNNQLRREIREAMMRLQMARVGA